MRKLPRLWLWMPFKLPVRLRKEGVEGWVVDRYRGRDKVARIG